MRVQVLLAVPWFMALAIDCSLPSNPDVQAHAAPAACVSASSSDSIGVASMRNDGTIILQLRADGSKGERGEGYFEYPTSHPQYASILAHVGPLKPGESKLVAPWPEEKDAK